MIEMDRLLCSVYSLNSSQTKRVFIGLEYDDSTQLFLPKLRLTGRDSNDVAFTMEDWTELKSKFSDITLFYSSYNRKIFGERINTGKHTVKMISYNNDRAIEISEAVDEVDGPQKKKYVPCMIYKFATFENLKKIIGAIDNKMYVLQNIADSLEKVIYEFVVYLHDVLQKPHDAQLFMMEARMIETANISLKDENVDKIKKILKDEYEYDISRNEISSLFYDLTCLKPDYLAYKYNECFEKSG